MRIGYIILCHKDPELVAAIANKVTEGTDNKAIIHVDAKVKMDSFIQNLKNNDKVVFLEDRYAIYWGGFSSIQATMAALEEALKYDCDRYVLLQGCDYPLHSNQYIDAFFEKNSSIEFLKAYNITKSKRKFNYMKCFGYHFYDGVNRNEKTLRTLFARVLTGFNKIGIKYRKGYYQDGKRKFDIYWGWGHFALTKGCVEYVLDIYKNNPNLNKYFNHVFPPDETYIQTIVYNSPYREQVVDCGPVNENDHLTVESMLNLTYFEYPSHVTEFVNPAQINREIASQYLYVRKVTMDFVTAVERKNEKSLNS